MMKLNPPDYYTLAPGEHMTRFYVRCGLDLFGNFLTTISDSQSIGVGAYTHSQALAYLSKARILGLAAQCLVRPEGES
jgi:hypothetical protein